MGFKRCCSLLSITSNLRYNLCMSRALLEHLYGLLSYLAENSGMYLDKVNVKVRVKSLLDHADFIYKFNMISGSKTL